jgi:hypothetical protein
VSADSLQSVSELFVEEMPDLNRLQERIRSRGGVVLGVSVDEDCRNFEHFLKEHPVAFRTTCSESLNKKVSLDYGTSRIPETYIIDRQGRIARKVVGPQWWDSAEMMGVFRFRSCMELNPGAFGNTRRPALTARLVAISQK